MPTHEDRAADRIRRATVGLQDYYRKLFRLRRVALGDHEALTSQGVGRNFDIGMKYHRRFRETYPDILNQSFTEGRNNDIFNGLSTLVEQAVMHYPNVEIRGLSPHMQVVGQQWLRDRLLASNAVEHNKMAVWDHLLGGAGDMYIGNDQGKPTIRWADTLDILFDQTARLPCDVRWKAVTVCNPLDVWIDMFPGATALKDYANRSTSGQYAKKAIAADLPFELVFYYDVDGPKGSYLVFIRTSETNIDPKPVAKGDNPNYIDVNGDRQAFLPFETLFYSAVPGQRLPFGAMEKALPAQIAIWDGITRLQNIRDGSPAFMEIVRSVMGDKSEEEFKEALLNGLVFVDEMGKVKEHAAGTMDQIDAEEVQRNRQALKEQLGISNNTMGQPEKSGPMTATESRAITQLGSLSASSIAKDNADLWSRFVPKFVAKGKLYDDKPIVIRFQGDKNPSTGETQVTEMAFGKGTPSGPIGDYLRPDAEYIVTEDQLRRIPADQRILKAKAAWDLAVEAAQMGFEEGLEPALREYYFALGADDIEVRLKRAMQAPGGMAGAQIPGMAPMPGGMPGQPMVAGVPG